MMMSEKHSADVGKRNTELPKALQRAAPGVENELLPACFDQRTRPKAFQARRRRAATQQSHTE
jgi:hypothetical protein